MSSFDLRLDDVYVPVDANFLVDVATHRRLFALTTADVESDFVGERRGRGGGEEEVEDGGEFEDEEWEEEAKGAVRRKN